MKKVILLTSFLVFSLYCFTQNSSVTYTKYTLVGTGQISIPSTLELQAGDYKKKAENLHKAVGNEISGDRVVFQLKGFNDGLYPNTPSYERIMFYTIKGAYGQFKKLTSKNIATKQELIDIEKKDYQEQINSPIPIKMLSYDGASIVFINGQPAIKTACLRQIEGNEPCYIEIYHFQNNDRVHRLSISYRKSQAHIWKPIFEQVLNSFTITNIR